MGALDAAAASSYLQAFCPIPHDMSATACLINKHAYRHPRSVLSKDSLIVEIGSARERHYKNQPKKLKERDDQRPNNLECVPLASFLSNPDLSSFSHRWLCWAIRASLTYKDEKYLFYYLKPTDRWLFVIMAEEFKLKY